MPAAEGRPARARAGAMRVLVVAGTQPGSIGGAPEVDPASVETMSIDKTLTNKDGSLEHFHFRLALIGHRLVPFADDSVRR